MVFFITTIFLCVFILAYVLKMRSIGSESLLLSTGYLSA
jgi:hypothetical protein